MHVRSARAHARTFPVRRVILWLSVAVVSIGAIVSIAIANRTVPPITESAPPYNQLSVGDSAPLFSAATTQGVFSLEATHRPFFSRFLLPGARTVNAKRLCSISSTKNTKSASASSR